MIYVKTYIWTTQIWTDKNAFGKNMKAVTQIILIH